MSISTTPLMALLSFVTRFRRFPWLAWSLPGLLALACASDTDTPGPGAGGTGAAAGVGGASSGTAGVGTLGGSAGAPTGGFGGTSTAGASGSSAGTPSGGAGLGSAGTGGQAGAGTSGGAGVAGNAGGNGGSAAGTAGAGGASAGSSGAGGAAAGMSGSSGAGGAPGFQPCPMSGACVILPFGDSITDGFGTPGGYRMELFRLAREDDHEINYVGSLQNGPSMVDGVMFPSRHEGHSGWKINQLLDLVPAPAFNTMPHIVLLMIGTNDVIQNDNLAQAPARLEGLLDEIIMTAPDALVVVGKITPMSNSDAQIRAYNDAIPGLVAERVTAGKHVIVVDQYTGFPMNELADGIHPNPAGYTRMAGVWYTAIEPYLR
jgi:lysophospholipase L1-like esterase